MQARTWAIAGLIFLLVVFFFNSVFLHHTHTLSHDTSVPRGQRDEHAEDAGGDAQGFFHEVEREAEHEAALAILGRIDALDEKVRSLTKTLNELSEQDLSLVAGKSNGSPAEPAAPAAPPAPAEDGEVINIHVGDKAVPSWKKATAAIASSAATKGECALAKRKRIPTHISIDELYDGNPFQNPHGGAWTQGWDVQYSANEWSNDAPLKVFVVPHSHNDPGWVKTLDEYFIAQTNNIITKMVDKLTEDPAVKFVWAEISYLSMWWERQGSGARDKFKRLVDRGQLEIVTGGWVMPDEANSHYYAVIDQLIEGHQWLEKELGIKPASGWSIDPFGHSPTMAYINKRAGFKGMVIQRIHYEVKRMLAEKKNLEFMWTQEWDRDQKTAMYTHMMPFYSYDAPHSCGPTPKICCQFDFARLPSVHRYSCPWHVPPEEITPYNVAERAQTLLDQYRKKAQLYRTKNVMIPLGDDFRWDTNEEIDAQVRNYKRIFEYINSHKELHAEVRFGTLGEYFDSVIKDSGAEKGQPLPGFPTFRGDFFSYADRNDNYWTGYFTSRPFYKYLDRVLESKLRAAEVLYTLASETDHKYWSERYESLQTARRNLGVFQHHDGVTGTAKDRVVVDYGERLIKSITLADTVAADMVQALLLPSKKPSGSFVAPESDRPVQDLLPTRKVLDVASGPHRVVFQNSLAQGREQMVSVLATEGRVEVRGPDGSIVPSQTHPVWAGDSVDIESGRWEIWFEVSLPPLGVAVYTVGPNNGVGSRNNGANTEVRNTHGRSPSSPMVTASDSSSEIILENDMFTLTVDGSTGLMRKMKAKKSGLVTDINLQFMTYGVTDGPDKSGAYLFMPDGPAVSYAPDPRPLIRVCKGALLDEVSVVQENVVHVVRVFKSAGVYASAISITNTVDVRSMMNRELLMRFRTNVNNDRFFTDLNGFEMRQRRTLSKIPLNGNYFPFPTLAFLEDSKQRVTLHTRSAVGIAGLEKGWLEVMLDRRLAQDDNRGVEQGVRDNKVTVLEFALQAEVRESGDGESVSVNNPTLLGHMVSELHNHPMGVFFIHGAAVPKGIRSAVAPLKTSLPCDVFLLNLRMLDTKKKTSALLLHRKGFECDFGGPGDVVLPCGAGGKVDVGALFADLAVYSIQEHSLSLMHATDSERRGTSDMSVLMAPGEISSFKLSLSNHAHVSLLMKAEISACVTKLERAATVDSLHFPFHPSSFFPLQHLADFATTLTTHAIHKQHGKEGYVVVIVELLRPLSLCPRRASRRPPAIRATLRRPAHPSSPPFPRAREL